MYTILIFGMAQAVLILGVSLFQGWPYFRGVFILVVSLFQGCPYFRGVLISGVSLFQRRLFLISEASFLYFRVVYSSDVFQCQYCKCVYMQCTGQCYICICHTVCVVLYVL